LGQDDGVLSELPPSFPSTRDALHRVAAHVLARRRHAYTGRIGLRPSPGGMATPAFGDDIEVVRTSGSILVTERASITNRAPLTTLGAAADFAGVDLDLAFSAGDDTPPVGDAGEALAIDDEAARALGRWFAFGLGVIDELVATEPAATAADVPQVWPEHFDLGCIVTVGGDGGLDAGIRASLGASPGDATEPLPYFYLSPWLDDRPGDPSYWNAPFGALQPYGSLAALPAADQRAAAVAFLRTGIGHLMSSRPSTPASSRTTS
jgi:hypothetical protein